MSNAKLPKLMISDNKRFLTTEQRKPFFWLGDTAWELFHRLNREDAAYYLKTRAEQGYTVIQATLISELGGLTVPNPYGRLPLKRNEADGFDPSKPDLDEGYSYWDHVDYILDTAASYGLYMALIPVWGDKFRQAWGEGPEIMDGSNAYDYGKWLGGRYKDRTNLIWVVGGDRILETRKHFEVVDRMAAGLRESVGRDHLMTFHPQGAMSSSYHVHDEEWLDFNMIQSGHGPDRSNYKPIEADYNKQPAKPIIDAEPCYEDHPKENTEDGYFDAADVRKAAYYALFAGAFGHTYGHHSVWSMYIGEIGEAYGKPFFYELAVAGDYFLNTWKEALTKPGALQMQYVRRLMESRSMLDRVPDQELVVRNRTGSNHIRATRGLDYAMVYIPNGVRTVVRMGRIAGVQVTASWFNPRNGDNSAIGDYPNEGEVSFQPPSGGRGHDWVLLLDGKTI